MTKKNSTPGPSESKRKTRNQDLQEIKSKRTSRISGFIIFLLAFLLYANTIRNQFALDDYGVIVENQLTHEGIKAWPRIFSSGYRSDLQNSDTQLYRPLSRALFALEWQFFPGKPAPGHIMNIILFALSSWLLFRLLLRFTSGNLWLAFTASILFAAHPIHTDAVANIKGSDEILSFFFYLLCSLSAWRYVSTRSVFFLLLSAFLFFCSLLSKESAITFIVIIPLSLYFFSAANRDSLIKISLALFGVSLIYFLIRMQVIGNHPVPLKEIDNYLVAIPDTITRICTAVYLLGVYVWKFIFPYPLISDGSLHEFAVVNIRSWKFIVPAGIFTGALIFAGIRFPKKSITSFFIIYFFVTAAVVSNIFFLIGTNYGERLMFAPSLGFCVILAFMLQYFLNKKTEAGSASSSFQQNKFNVALTVIICLIYSVQTFSRNREWFDNLSLTTADIVRAPESARVHFYYGNNITQEDFLNGIKTESEIKEYKLKGIAELIKATEIYPAYASAYHKIAETYSKEGKDDAAEPYYQKAIQYDSLSPIYQNNFGNMLFKIKRYEEAQHHFARAVQLDSNYVHALFNLGQSQIYFARVYSTNYLEAKKSSDTLIIRKFYDRAIGNYDSAIYLMQKVVRLDPDFYMAYNSLSIIYQGMGKPGDASYYSGLSQESRQRSERKSKKK